jgi:hypothetical protein
MASARSKPLARCAPALVALSFGGLLLGVTSCRSATELTVTISTNASCEEVKTWQGVAVYVGKPGAESEEQAPTLVTNHCEGDGLIGSLVVVPSGAKDDVVGVRVVAGVAQSPEACTANGYKDGCIVARRAIRFTPHSDLALEVDLLKSCLNIGCDPQNTCIDKSCQPSAVAPPPAVSTPVPTPSPTTSTEPPAPGTPTVRCGDDGVFCATSGDVCCLTVDADAKTTHGDCRRASLCKGIVLNCDDDTDCPRGGVNKDYPAICSLSYTSNEDTPYVPLEIAHSQCLIAVPGNGGPGRPRSLALCEERVACADAQFPCMASGSSLLPGYNWCQVYTQ